MHKSSMGQHILMPSPPMQPTMWRNLPLQTGRSSVALGIRSCGSAGAGRAETSHRRSNRKIKNNGKNAYAFG